MLTQELISVLNQVSDDLHRSGFSLKSGFKKIVLTQELILVLNRVSQKDCLHQFFLYLELSDQTFKMSFHGFFVSYCLTDVRINFSTRPCGLICTIQGEIVGGGESFERIYIKPNGKI